MKVSDVRVWEVKCSCCAKLDVKSVKEDHDGDLFIEVSTHVCIQEGKE